jgi:AcrR family transcriptional regulator
MKQKERDHKIARAAARLFAHQGYRGTSTHEIARVAGISENTLFRHFENKENLFWTAFRLSLAEWNLPVDLLKNIEADAGPDVVLPQFLAQVVDVTILNPDLLRLMAVAFLERRSKAREICLESFKPFLATINRYLAMQIEGGKLKTLEPTLITAAIVAMAWMHPVILEFNGGDAAPHSSNRNTIRALSQFWIDALTPSKDLWQQSP